ncbi:MAG: MlaD family protein [Solirubrobacteraceae bacterium]|nr:MlaD family protein [Solirubrobacteraceae bacterium]
MPRAIRQHAGVVTFLVLMLVAGLMVAGYVLVQQRVALPGWIPGTDSAYKTYRVELSTAQALTPGQGQQVLVSGVDVGDITDVELRDGGAAIVDIRVRERHAHLVRRDTTALVRPKSGLNDMSLELAAGTGADPRVAPEGYVIPDARTSSNVHLDEILSSLDSDTRMALGLLLDGVGEGVARDPRRLAKALQELSPVTHNLRRIGEALEDRSRQVSRAVNVTRRVADALADNRTDAVRAVRSTDRLLSVVGARDGEIRAALRELPGTLRETDRALDAGVPLADEVRRTSVALRPLARELPRSLRAQTRMMRATEPVIRTRLTPFARQTIAPVRTLQGVARRTHDIHPDTDAISDEVQRFGNMLAYDPPGDDEHGYLFYQQWLNANLPWVFNTRDAHGPIRRLKVTISCSTLAILRQLAQVDSGASLLETVLSGLSDTSACPASTPPPGGTP